MMKLAFSASADGRAFNPAASHAGKPSAAAVCGPVLLALLLGGLDASAWSQQSRFPVTDDQRQTADKIAQAGVPLSELAPGAPDRYTIKRGDTLWAISIIFLKSPWRWPELWGMNKLQIANPHLIYPGQVLELIKSGGRAQLRLVTGESAAPAPAAAAPEPAAPALASVKLHPRVRDLGDIGTAGLCAL